MRVAVTGASGLVGSALVEALAASGHRVQPLVRGRPRTRDAIAWDPAAGRIDEGALEGVDAVVHLAGENISAGRWTASRRASILRSRVDGTGLVARTIAGLASRPRVMISASAVGYYGDRGDEVLEESAARGEGFLADVCAAWEGATASAEAAGIRVVRMRTGVVLSGAGGALPRMLLPFRLFVGGRVGSGRQWVSWISRTDLAAAVLRLLDAGDVSGPVNVTAPEPVTNRELARAIGRVLRRPAWLPTPAFALRLAFGRMSRVLLDSARAVPARLLASGFAFRHPDVETALRAELGRPAGGR